MAEEETHVWASGGGGAGEVRVVPLTAARLPAALALMRESYYTDESLAKATQLQGCPQAVDELERLTTATWEDGASLVALRGGEHVVGVAFNKVQRPPAPGTLGFFDLFKEHQCTTEEAKEYMDLMMRIDARKDVFAHYGVAQSLELMFIVSSRCVRRQGVGLLLVRGAMALARARGLPLCQAIFSSNGSQRIGAILEWDSLVTCPMAEFSFRGQPYSRFTGEHQSFELMACRV